MNNNKKLFLYILIIIIAETFIYIFLNNINYEKEDKIKEKYISRLDTHIQAILNSNESISSIIISEILSRKDIKNILNNINTQDEDLKNRNRELLLNALTPTFNSLKSHGFNQFQFHDKDGNSFLRFYGTNNFGDNLLDFRNSIKEAQNTKRAQFGFEVGKMQSGFRNVFPIIIDEEFLGTVELSNSFDNIHHALHKNFPYEYKFIISKNYLNSSMDKNQILEYYITSAVSNNFYEEKFSQCDINIISKETIEKINSNLKVEIKEILDDFKPFVTDIKLGDIDYVLSFLPIKSFDKSINTYIISYIKDDEISEAKISFYLNFFIANLIIISLIVLYLLRVNFLEKKIFIKKAYTDALTNLLNRAKFNFDVNELINSENLNEYSLILYDIDFFKKVNDTYGHDVGDIVLKEFSNITKNSLRKDDLVYRWGGEEFIALVKTTLKDDLVKISEKMRIAVENYTFTGIKNLTSSFGVVCANSSDTIDSLVKKADEALYTAKQTGRNRVVFYEDLESLDK